MKGYVTNVGYMGYVDGRYDNCVASGESLGNVNDVILNKEN